jgi:uncharacterized Zn-binding protein involved in type VI secretion
MGQPIIVEGDTTTTGGRMIASQTTNKTGGKAIIVQGDRYSCPSCKSIGSVVQASSMDKINGIGIAYNTCKVQCGCSGNQMVMASQTVDTVEVGASSLSRSSQSSYSDNRLQAASAALVYDLFFQLKHHITGKLLVDTPYKITLPDGTTVQGESDDYGHTQKISADSPLIASIEAPYYGNNADTAHTNLESDTCSC